MPSHWEGFGLTAAEAMAAGIPVVGTDVPGLREVVEEGVTGFLIPGGEAEMLADKLLVLLRDPERAAEMGRKGCARARERFDAARCSEKWLEAYQSLLAVGSA
jgi:glycosyltransferase involved in cell wall biosynthesis